MPLRWQLCAWQRASQTISAPSLAPTEELHLHCVLSAGLLLGGNRLSGYLEALACTSHVDLLAGWRAGLFLVITAMICTHVARMIWKPCT